MPCSRTWSTRASWWTAKPWRPRQRALRRHLKTAWSRLSTMPPERRSTSTPPSSWGISCSRNCSCPHGKKTKTGWSTNADVLEKLRHAYPIVDDVLRFRQYTKLKSTYVDGLMKVIDMDGRIRTSFQMTVTATGPLSSTEPNSRSSHTHRAGQPAAADVHGGGGLCAGRCGLLPDRAAPAGAYVRRQGHAGVFPVR